MLEGDERRIDPCNVFVKHLPGDMGDEQLAELFSQQGSVVSAKVMVDPQTYESLGFGFVRFETPEETSRAIQEFNGLRLKWKTLLCKHSNARNQIKSTNLYIKPLLPDTTEEDLRELFTPYGEIETVKVLTDKKSGTSRQIGFVQFVSQGNADRALQDVDGHRLAPGTPALTVKYAETQEEKLRRRERMKRRLRHTPGLVGGGGGGSPSSSPMQYAVQEGQPEVMGPLPYSGRGQDPSMSHMVVPPGQPRPPQMQPQLPPSSHSYYMPAGYPSYAYPSYPMYPSPHDGYNGFVSPQGYPFPGFMHVPPPGMQAPSAPYGYPSPMQQHPHHSMLEGNSHHHPHHPAPFTSGTTATNASNIVPSEHSNCTLFVFHWPADVPEEEMQALFEGAGTVESAQMARQDSGEPRGFGFVRMACAEDAQRAIDMLHGHTLGKKRLQVSLKRDTNRQHREAFH